MLASEKKILFDFFTATHNHLSHFKNRNKSAVIFLDDSPLSKKTPQSGLRKKPKIENESARPMSFAELSKKIHSCSRCALCKSRKNPVEGTGVLQPLVLVIGEAPGADEDAKGLPFIGRAGMLLDKMLAAISLSRTENCYITNILKCRPPANRDPLPDERDACFPFLQNQIHLLAPKAILLLGRIAAQKLLNTQGSLSRLHGIFFDYERIPVLATYHPSALLRDESLKRFAWNDLKIFRSKLAKISGDYARTLSEK